MANYIHQLKDWPYFKWDEELINPMLTKLQQLQGKLLGRMEALGLSLQAQANLETLTMDLLQSSEIEGEPLDAKKVRSSIARRLGMDNIELMTADRHVEGAVEMILDATQQYEKPLSKERIFAWHAALNPTGGNGMHKMLVAGFRDNTITGPMQVVSGPMGKGTVQYEAPSSENLEIEMLQFLNWVNEENKTDALVKAAIAHLWFVTIHPFKDGNGRIARAIADMLLSRSDNSKERFYSMSAQIQKEQKDYYTILRQTQKGSLDITIWIQWFFACLERAFANSYVILAQVLTKAVFWGRRAGIAFNERQKLMINILFDDFAGKLTTSKWAKITKCSNDTALRDIQDLVAKKILEKEGAGGRSTCYILNR